MTSLNTISHSRSKYPKRRGWPALHPDGHYLRASGHGSLCHRTPLTSFTFIGHLCAHADCILQTLCLQDPSGSPLRPLGSRGDGTAASGIDVQSRGAKCSVNADGSALSNFVPDRVYTMDQLWTVTDCYLVQQGESTTTGWTPWSCLWPVA